MKNPPKSASRQKGSHFMTLDSALTKVNHKDTLQYFSNLSTVRDHCNIEQLDEFVQLMHRKGSSIMHQWDPQKEQKESSCPRRKRFNERQHLNGEQREQRKKRIAANLKKVTNMPLTKRIAAARAKAASSYEQQFAYAQSPNADLKLEFLEIGDGTQPLIATDTNRIADEMGRLENPVEGQQENQNN